MRQKGGGTFSSEVIRVDEELQRCFIVQGLLRIEGGLHWWHVPGTEALSHYMPHAKRRSTAADALGVLPGFRGRAIHGAWRSYSNYGGKHGLCNAHHLRELTVRRQMVSDTDTHSLSDTFASTIPVKPLNCQPSTADTGMLPVFS